MKQFAEFARISLGPHKTNVRVNMDFVMLIGRSLGTFHKKINTFGFILILWGSAFSLFSGKTYYE